MRILFMNSLFRRLILLKRKTKETIISVTGTKFITSADNGKSYSLDSLVASMRLPDLTTISAGWSISVTCTFVGRYVLVLPGDIGFAYFQYDGGDCDGVSLDAIGVSVVITFDGTYYTAPVTPNVAGYAV